MPQDLHTEALLLAAKASSSLDKGVLQEHLTASVCTAASGEAIPCVHVCLSVQQDTRVHSAELQEPAQPLQAVPEMWPPFLPASTNASCPCPKCSTGAPAAGQSASLEQGNVHEPQHTQLPVRPGIAQLQGAREMSQVLAGTLLYEVLLNAPVSVVLGAPVLVVPSPSSVAPAVGQPMFGWLSK